MLSVPLLEPVHGKGKGLGHSLFERRGWRWYFGVSARMSRSRGSNGFSEWFVPFRNTRRTKLRYQSRISVVHQRWDKPGSCRTSTSSTVACPGLSSSTDTSNTTTPPTFSSAKAATIRGCPSRKLPCRVAFLVCVEARTHLRFADIAWMPGGTYLHVSSDTQLNLDLKQLILCGTFHRAEVQTPDQMGILADDSELRAVAINASCLC